METQKILNVVKGVANSIDGIAPENIVIAGNEEGFTFDTGMTSVNADVEQIMTDNNVDNGSLVAAIESYAWGEEAVDAGKFSFDYNSAKDSIVSSVSGGATMTRPFYVAGNEDFGNDVVGSYKEIQIATNVAITSHESIIEAIYPTIVGSLTSGGVRFEATYSVVNNRFLRTDPAILNNDTVGDSIVKLSRKLTDNPFGNRTIKLVPAITTKTQDYLYLPATYTDEDTKKETAPVKVNLDNSIDFGALCLDDASLINAISDHTMNFDGTIFAEQLYFKLEDADGNVSEHKAYIGLKSSAQWTATFTGDAKDMVLTMTGETLAINADTIKTITGATSAVINNLDIEGYKIYLKYSISASLNTRTMAFIQDAKKLILAKVVDENGVVLSAGEGKYDDIKDVIDLSTITGIVHDANKTNLNLEEFGVEVDVRTKSEIFKIGYVDPQYFRSSVFDKNATTSGVNLINQGVNTQTFTLGLKALDKQFAVYRKANESGMIEDLKDTMSSVAGKFIEPCFLERTLELQEMVDAQETDATIKNIGALISNNIQQMMNDLVSTSGILNAVKLLGMGEKPTLTIVTDTKIQSALVNHTDILKLANWNVEIVAEDHEVLINKVRVIPTIKPKGNSINLFTNTFRGVIPTPVVDVVSTTNSNTTKRTVIQPAYGFFHRLALGLELQVNGFSEIVKSKNVYMTQDV